VIHGDPAATLRRAEFDLVNVTSSPPNFHHLEEFDEAFFRGLDAQPLSFRGIFVSIE
jgi:hypothetical protein